MYFFIFKSKFLVHSHGGDMSNMGTNVEKQLDIQKQVNLCVCVRV